MSDSTRSVWSTSTTRPEAAATARGRNYVTTALGSDTETPTPGGSLRSGIPTANLSMRKRVIAKRPFSRLSDGERHPVTVTRIERIA